MARSVQRCHALGKPIGTVGGTLTKNGAGTWTLYGASTYTGQSVVNGGILSVANTLGLGTVAGGVVVNGGSLELQNNVSIGAELLSITGTGSASNGALRNLSGNNS